VVILVDENITPEAVSVLRNHDLQACHVNDLKTSKKHRIVDDQLRRLAVRKAYVIVTKDDDFVKSFVDRKVPEKMVYLFGSRDKKQDLSFIKRVAPHLNSYLQNHDFIEVNGIEIRFPFSD